MKEKFRPKLNKVTLVCVDTQHHMLSSLAIHHSMQECDFAHVLYITDRSCMPLSDVEIYPISQLPATGATAYSQFILKRLPALIKTDYVLIIQFDGFVLNGHFWDNKFYNYDYIGAPWPFFERYRVGNGGFSLRSKRLLEACLDPLVMLNGPSEDLNICRDYRSFLEVRYGIEFAPESLARCFSSESEGQIEQSFGFHGLLHLTKLYQGQHISMLLDHLADYLFQGSGGVILWTAYVFSELNAEAEQVKKRCLDFCSPQALFDKAVNLGYDPAWIRQHLSEVQ